MAITSCCCFILYKFLLFKLKRRSSEKLLQLTTIFSYTNNSWTWIGWHCGNIFSNCDTFTVIHDADTIAFFSFDNTNIDFRISPFFNGQVFTLYDRTNVLRSITYISNVLFCLSNLTRGLKITLIGIGKLKRA